MAVPSARSALAALRRPPVSNAVASSSRYLTTSPHRLATIPATTPSNEDSDTALPVPFPKINKFLSFPKVTPHEPKHGIHVATLHLQSYHPYNLDLTTQFAVHSAHSLNIPTSLPAFLPRERSLYTVLKSPFVKKKAQENFERRTHKRAIKVFDSDKEAIDLWLRYLRQNGLPGVGMKAYVHEYVEVGFGNKEQENLANDLQQGVADDEKKIQDAAEELVKALSNEEGQVKGVEVGEGVNAKDSSDKVVEGEKA